MLNIIPPRQYSSAHSKSYPALSPTSRKNLQDALIDSNPKASPPPRTHPTIAFSDEAGLSPKLKHELQKALTDNNAWAHPDPNDRVAKKAWVDRNAKELYAAFAKASKAELSTCGYEKLGDRCAAKEGTARDLRFTLMGIFEKYGPLVMMYKGRDALGRQWVSGWKLAKTTSDGQFHLAVVMCVEEEDEDEAKNQAPVLDSSSLVGKDDENWVLIKREQERWFKELKP